ncbi:AzlD domain-containing protein [Halomonas sp. H10-59]|uniref:AzlD domain-containing protein n=1 Tax=Halomonas sp. H10-59 TaxID=2950874 RepID=A0AAU7KQ74_9GAMM
MTTTLWMAVVATTLGTLLMRMAPLIWMRRRLAERQTEDSVEPMPQWLSVLGPLMIAAVLGVSLVPAQPNIASWSATGMGVLATLAVWYRTRSLGWPVAAGVAAYGLTLVLAGSL